MTNLYRTWVEGRKSQTWLILSAPDALTARQQTVEHWAGSTDGRTALQVEHIVAELKSA